MGAGLLITFSGIDGCGKSTQLEHLDRLLRSRGLRCRTIWYRAGYSTPLNRLRQLLRRTRSSMPRPGRSEERERILRRPGISAAWVTAAVIDTAVQYAITLRAALATHDVILCDRYLVDSLLDLRLHFPNVPLGLVPAVLHCTSVRPDLQLLMLLPWETVVERLQHKREPFPDEVSLRRRRYDHYVSLAKSPELHVVDAAGAERDVAWRIRELVEPLLAKRR